MRRGGCGYHDGGSEIVGALAGIVVVLGSALPASRGGGVRVLETVVVAAWGGKSARRMRSRSASSECTCAQQEWKHTGNMPPHQQQLTPARNICVVPGRRGPPDVGALRAL